MCAILDGRIERELENRRTIILDGRVDWLTGWNVIGTSLRIGAKSYYLTFATHEPVSDHPFAEDNAAFIDVLASQLANRYYQQDQLSRLISDGTRRAWD